MSTLTAERYQLSILLRDLKEKKEAEYEKHLTTLKEMNKENTSEFVEAMLSDKTAELSDRFILLQRFSNLISSTLDSASEQLLLQLGELQGITLLAHELIYTKDKKTAETNVLQQYLGRTYTKEILKYLYRHPSARHKELADELSVSASHLTEILTELIEADIVRKTRQSKYSFYSLSYQANEYTRTKLINGLNDKRDPYLSASFPMLLNSNRRYVTGNNVKINMIFTNRKETNTEEDAS